MLTAYSNDWEDKIVSVDGYKTSDYTSCKFNVITNILDLFGKDGWELGNLYTVTGTVHPN